MGRQTKFEVILNISTGEGKVYDNRNVRKNDKCRNGVPQTPVPDQALAKGEEESQE